MVEPHGLVCGLVAGTTTTAVFTPVDRALFLAHVHKRPFLLSANFSRPFQGVNQMLLQRVISSGLCFPLEDFARRHCPVARSGGSAAAHNFASGMAAGAVIACLTNPLAVVTAQKWRSTRDNLSMVEIARRLVQSGGVAALNRALAATLARDAIWGGAFSGLRHGLPKVLDSRDTTRKPGEYKPGMVSFTANLLAAGVAAAISSPFNYARNLQYGAGFAEKPATMRQIFSELAQEAADHHARTGRSPALFVANRLAIGWGTLRVSFGIALSSQIYATTMLHLQQHPRSP